MGGWQPFTKEQLEAFYNKAGLCYFLFNGLDSDGFVIKDGAQYKVTHEFVAKCFGASPSVADLVPSP